MKKKQGKRRVLLAMMMCLMLAFMTACGGKNAGAQGGGADGTANGQGQEAKTTENASGAGDNSGNASVTIESGPIVIFKLGTDTIAVYIKDKECEKLLPVGEHEESPNRMSLHDEEWKFQISFASFYANLSYPESEGNWANIDSGYEKNHVTKDSYFVCFSGDGICDKLDESKELILTKYSVNVDGEDEFYRGPASKIVQNVDMDQYANIVGLAYEAGKPQGDWAGTYMSDSYSDTQGYAEVSVTDSGAILIKSKIDGEEKEYIAIEELPEDGNDDPTYFFARTKVLNGGGGNNTYVEFQYHKSFYSDTEYYESISFGMDDYEKDIHKNSTMERLKEWRVAAPDYKDVDTIDKILKEDADDSKYFKKESDDYAISAYYDGEFTSERLKGEQYLLYNFDKLGRAASCYEKIVFNSAEDAQKLYNDRTKYESTDVYTLSGSIVYAYHPDNAYSGALTTKWDFLNQGGAASDWTLGTHYLYGWTNDAGEYTSQVYLSKPYTKEDFNVSIDDMIYWNTINNGYYANTANADNTLYISMGEYHNEIYINGALTKDGTRAKPFGETKIIGTTLKGFSATEEYDYNTSSYTYWLNFTELVFSDKEATLTQYCFKTDDLLSNDVTWDNYKSKTPDATITATYDLTDKW